MSQTKQTLRQPENYKNMVKNLNQQKQQVEISIHQSPDATKSDTDDSNHDSGNSESTDISTEISSDKVNTEKDDQTVLIKQKPKLIELVKFPAIKNNENPYSSIQKTKPPKSKKSKVQTNNMKVNKNFQFSTYSFPNIQEMPQYSFYIDPSVHHYQQGDFSFHQQYPIYQHHYQHYSQQSLYNIYPNNSLSYIYHHNQPYYQDSIQAQVIPVVEQHHHFQETQNLQLKSSISKKPTEKPKVFPKAIEYDQPVVISSSTTEKENNSQQNIKEEGDVEQNDEIIYDEQSENYEPPTPNKTRLNKNSEISHKVRLYISLLNTFSIFNIPSLRSKIRDSSMKRTRQSFTSIQGTFLFVIFKSSHATIICVNLFCLNVPFFYLGCN